VKKKKAKIASRKSTSNLLFIEDDDLKENAVKQQERNERENDQVDVFLHVYKSMEFLSEGKRWS
jgi:hypothetical protein